MWQNFKNYYHLLKAIFALIYFHFPARGMIVIGVTGTDGKTTTANLIYHILYSVGRKVGIISTVSAKIAGKEYDTGFHVSTPDSFILQSYIRRAKSAGCRYLILEVTSHALDQNRVFGIPFYIGVLTNISREHLDYHKTMENYQKTKAKLFKHADIAILNYDDSSYQVIKKKIDKKRTTILTYGLGKKADINPGNFIFKSSLPGLFNLYNSLAAITATKKLGVKDEEIIEAMKSFTLPKGRVEEIYNKDFKVVIDFAHTPNALSLLLETMKQETKGRIIHVFGSAGERDRGKREIMGEVSAKYADFIILTAEDPRHESIRKINQQIREGIGKNIKVVEIIERKEAIEYALNEAKKNDLVIITGKGHESSMNIGGKEFPWSDHQVAENYLKSFKKL